MIEYIPDFTYQVVSLNKYTNEELSKKHDEIYADFAEYLKRGIAFEQIEAVLANQHTCQYHSCKVRNVQFAENHRSKQNHAQNKEEDPCRVGDWQILKSGDCVQNDSFSCSLNVAFSIRMSEFYANIHFLVCSSFTFI